MKIIKHILFIALLCFILSPLKAQMIAVKSDIAKDLAMTPSLGLDFVVGNKQTFGIEAFFNNNPWGLEMNMFGVSPHFRYWFNGRPYTRQFVGISALAVNYDIHWKNSIYEGNAIGPSLTFGHVVHLSQRFNLELCTGVSLLFYKQKNYFEEDNYSDYGERTNDYGTILFPKVNISISYIIN